MIDELRAHDDSLPFVLSAVTAAFASGRTGDATRFIERAISLSAPWEALTEAVRLGLETSYSEARGLPIRLHAGT
jgi:hypothetical protein